VARKGMGGGMPGGMDMQALLKQAQQMQTDMMQAQEALKDEEVEASAGGGMVKVTITGDLVIKDVAIDPDAVDPEDVDMLSDMVQAAVNEAIRSAQELAASKMPDMPGMRTSEIIIANPFSARSCKAASPDAADCVWKPFAWRNVSSRLRCP